MNSTTAQMIPGEQFLVSYYHPPISNTYRQQVKTLQDVYTMITKCPELKRKTFKYRGIIDTTEKYKFKMTHFPNVTFSGTFGKRCENGLLSHSGLICLDHDHLPDVEAFANVLTTDVRSKDSLVLGFRSPSGDGYKSVYWFDNIAHNQAYAYRFIANYIKSITGIPCDMSGSNLSRACFLCHDSSAYLNPHFLNFH
jgi:hypothetical protein